MIEPSKTLTIAEAIDEIGRILVCVEPQHRGAVVEALTGKPPAKPVTMVELEAAKFALDSPRASTEQRLAAIAIVERALGIHSPNLPAETP